MQQYIPTKPAAEVKGIHYKMKSTQLRGQSTSQLKSTSNQPNPTHKNWITQMSKSCVKTTKKKCEEIGFSPNSYFSLLFPFYFQLL